MPFWNVVKLWKMQRGRKRKWAYINMNAIYKIASEQITLTRLCKILRFFTGEKIVNFR